LIIDPGYVAKFLKEIISLFLYFFLLRLLVLDPRVGSFSKAKSFVFKSLKTEAKTDLKSSSSFLFKKYFY
jgi:hypothetical protein